MKRIALFAAVLLAFSGCTKKYRIGDITLETIKFYEPSKEMISSAPAVFTVDAYQIRKFEDTFVVSFALFEEQGRIYFADAVETAYALALAKREGFAIEKSSIQPSALEDFIRFKKEAIADMKEKLRDVTAKINANEDLGIEKEETRAFKILQRDLTAQIAMEKLQLNFLEYSKFVRDSTGGTNYEVEALNIQDLLKRMKEEKLLARINKIWIANPNAILEIKKGILIMSNTKQAIDAIKEYIKNMGY